MSFDLQAALNNWVVCQKRTGKSKAFVFVQPEERNGQLVGGQTVIKGPFTQERAQTVLTRSERLRQWGMPFVVHPTQVLNGTGLKAGEQGWYLVYPNLAAGYPLNCSVYTESMTNAQGGQYTYRVLQRQGLVKLGDVITEIDWLNKPYTQGSVTGGGQGPPGASGAAQTQSGITGGGQGPPGASGAAQTQSGITMNLPAWLVVSMTGLFAMGVGDVHLANILADLQKQEIWIIDYDDNRAKEDSGELYYFKMAPAKDKLAKWLSLVQPYYPQIIQVLQPFTQDPQYGPKFQQAIGYLSQVGQQQQNVNQLVQQMGGMQIGQQTVLNIQGPISNVGRMQYNGPFNATTYSGFSTDVVKSQLQKAIRRNEPEKAVMAAFELYRLSEVPNGEPVRSNLYNRLAIIAAEDIGPASLGVVVDAAQVNLTKNRDPNTLGALVQTMAASPKTRVMSHIYRALMTPEGRQLAQARGIPVDDQPTPEDLASLGNNGISWQPTDPPEIRAYAEIFKRRLEAQSMTAFIWLYYYMLASDKKKIAPRAIRPRRRQTDPMMVIWYTLQPFLAPIVWESLLDCFLEITENRPFLMCGAVSALYRVPYKEVDLRPLAIAWRDGNVAQKYLTGQYQFEISPEAIDKHTKQGRQAGKGREEFAKEGSLVTPEDPQFIIPQFKEIYML